MTRTDWICGELNALFDLPVTELVFPTADVLRLLGHNMPPVGEDAR